MVPQRPVPDSATTAKVPPLPDSDRRDQQRPLTPPARQTDAHAPRPVLACVDGTPNADSVVRHARMLADVLGEPLVILQVREPEGGQGPADPIEWEIARREASAQLEALANSAGNAACGTEILLGQGWAPDAINDAARSLSAGLIVLGTMDHSRPPAHAPRGLATTPLLGMTASHVLARSDHCVLLQPPMLGHPTARPYRRILVPLDGSCWAEAAIPMAVHLARSAGAELLLAHVVTQPRLTGQQLPEAEGRQLQEQLASRNERVGRIYLERMRRAIADQVTRVDTRAFRSADSRTGLAELIRAEPFDLVILSARGHGAMDAADLPYGSTVGYLAGRFPVSILVVRPEMPDRQLPARQAGGLPARPRVRQPR